MDRAAEYAAEDADVTLRLHRAIWPQIEALPRLKALYETIEQPLVPVLFRMERTGVLVDRELLKAQSAGARGAHAGAAGAGARRGRSGPFNVDSPKQLQEILFGKLGMPVTAQDADRPAVDGRGRARGAGRVLSRCRD